MKFKEFFSIMKNRISDGADVPSFFRILVSMITDATEEEWGTQKDPATKLTKENTLRSYAKKGLPKKFAQSIMYRLSPENFIESLESHPEAVLQLLAEDFQPYDASATKYNIAEKLANCFMEIIRTKAGLVPQDTLETQQQQKQASDLKSKYGNYLLNETNYTCPFPGCGRSLNISNAGKIATSFEVCLIDKKKAPDIENLLALCPVCYASYSIDDSKKICKELTGVKKILIEHQHSSTLINEFKLEKGIIGVISKIKKLNQKDLENASLDPKEIKQKLDPVDNYVLYMTVNNAVTTYFLKIKEIMMNMDKCGKIDYDDIQDQMHAIYKKLKKAKKTNIEIFNEIAKKIHQISLQEDIYCQIIVSYFIQSCEVFDAIT